MNAGAYAHIVRDKAVHRRLADMGKKIEALAADQSLPAEEAVERAEQHLLSLSRHVSDRKPEHVADIGDERYKRYTDLHEATDKSALFGLTTGFRDLDQMLTGLPPGCLVFVAARPSIGKSSLALDLTRHAAQHQGKNAAVFSLTGDDQARDHGPDCRGLLGCRCVEAQEREPQRR